jgi:acetoin utilization deacetylase AcuC-like enzyme
MRRILIVDWDAHHGNGIQEVFYEEKEVLYFSSHFMGWYPRTGDWEETGRGEGSGYAVNLPLPIEIGDNDLAGLYANILGSVVESFKPELIVVAAGFDGHYLDPVGRLKLTEKCFGELTQVLLNLREACGGVPVLLVLEGGYDVTALAVCVRQVLRVLVTGRPGAHQGFSLSDTAMKLLEKVRDIHRKFGVWCG